ncbi:MAG: SDR family NAD(P)-dependent oxidoreductase [Gammaproteobacteria bacterium]|nr:SDR family NAD(P)-dependent oxidoreductase [Gammaproteobacteria bacterium]
MTYQNVLITGNSSGLGLAFTRHLLQQGTSVFGLSRRGCPLEDKRLSDIRCDMADLDSIAPALDELLGDTRTLDLVLLNAGILGEIRDLHETPVADIEHVMRINVWANKIVLDTLLSRSIACKQIVLISSGAGVNGNKGWGAYSLSKAALNMLTMLYAHEMPQSHLSALAPGLVDTAMQDYLCDETIKAVSDFPSLGRLRSARGTVDMPTPDVAAQKILDTLPELLKQASGSYSDIRSLAH